MERSPGLDPDSSIPASSVPLGLPKSSRWPVKGSPLLGRTKRGNASSPRVSLEVLGSESDLGSPQLASPSPPASSILPSSSFAGHSNPSPPTPGILSTFSSNSNGGLGKKRSGSRIKGKAGPKMRSPSLEDIYAYNTLKAFHTLPANATLQSYSASIRSTVEVTVVRGQNLPAHSSGASDPYCKVYITGAGSVKKQKTKVQQKTSNPVWNQHFVFSDFPFPINPATPNASTPTSTSPPTNSSVKNIPIKTTISPDSSDSEEEEEENGEETVLNPVRRPRSSQLTSDLRSSLSHIPGLGSFAPSTELQATTSSPSIPSLFTNSPNPSTPHPPVTHITSDPPNSQPLLSSSPPTSLASSATSSSALTLFIECYDKDNLRDDFSGRVSISLASLPRDTLQEFQMDLKEVECGTLTFQVLVRDYLESDPPRATKHKLFKEKKEKKEKGLRQLKSKKEKEKEKPFSISSSPSTSSSPSLPSSLSSSNISPREHQDQTNPNQNSNQMPTVSITAPIGIPTPSTGPTSLNPSPTPASSASFTSSPSLSPQGLNVSGATHLNSSFGLSNSSSSSPNLNLSSNPQKPPNDLEPPPLDLPGTKDWFFQEVFGDSKSKKKKHGAEHRKDEDTDDSGEESDEEDEGSDDDEPHLPSSISSASHSSSVLPTLNLSTTKSDDTSHSPRSSGLSTTSTALNASNSAIFGSEVRLIVDEVVSFDLPSLTALLFADPNFTIEIHTLENDTDIFVEPWQRDETKERYRREVRLRKKKIVECKVCQTQRFRYDSTGNIIYFDTSTLLEGGPFSEYFTVDSRWIIKQTVNRGSHVKIWIYVDFKKKVTSLIRGKFEATCLDETADFYKNYMHLCRSKIHQLTENQRQQYLYQQQSQLLQLQIQIQQQQLQQQQQMSPQQDQTVNKTQEIVDVTQIEQSSQGPLIQPQQPVVETKQVPSIKRPTPDLSSRTQSGWVSEDSLYYGLVAANAFFLLLLIIYYFRYSSELNYFVELEQELFIQEKMKVVSLLIEKVIILAQDLNQTSTIPLVV